MVILRGLHAFGLLLLLACAPQNTPADSVGDLTAEGESTVRGIVRTVGSAPVNVQVVLVSEGRSIRLVGPLAEELARTAGIEVNVEGTLRPSPDPMADMELEATGYRIRTANGQPAVMGEIVEIMGDRARLRTDDGEIVILSSVPRDFRVGQRVWVQGPGGITVQSYGILRP